MPLLPRNRRRCGILGASGGPREKGRDAAAAGAGDVRGEERFGWGKEGKEAGARVAALGGETEIAPVLGRGLMSREGGIWMDKERVDLN